MKIVPPGLVPNLLNRVNEKPDAEGFQQQMKQQDQGQEQKKEKEEGSSEAEEHRLQVALEEFRADPHAKANGITADSTGQGPGLKVVLKDGSGAILRQLSGEEFVRLRETLAEASSNSGKILDQKL